MAICNLFNTLDKESGNFMLFSQYVEDITRNYAEGENWRVIPSRFVALDINYANINEDNVIMVEKEGETGEKDYDTSIPKYFQNYFENACAYGRENYANYASGLASDSNDVVNIEWTPEISRNLFWNSMFDGGFLTISNNEKNKIVNEVKYWSDINLQSYDEHQNMGYGEIYCYIPIDGKCFKCICNVNATRIYDSSNQNNTLEGYDNIDISSYSKDYYYNRDYTMSFDDSSLNTEIDFNASYYNINTIIVLYDIMKQVGTEWVKVYEYIPMGMYIAGKIDSETGNTTNCTKKYISTSYGTGTSYGLRICTRFTVSPKGMILKESDLTLDSNDYMAIGSLMTKMSECLNKMLDISNQQNSTIDGFKNALATIKNNRTNVPYVKKINNKDWWFVNGKAVIPVNN